MVYCFSQKCFFSITRYKFKGGKPLLQACKQVEVIYSATGEQLAKKGFAVDLPKLYDGTVFEISRLK